MMKFFMALNYSVLIGAIAQLCEEIKLKIGE